MDRSALQNGQQHDIRDPVTYHIRQDGIIGVKDDAGLVVDFGQRRKVGLNSDGETDMPFAASAAVIGRQATCQVRVTSAR